MVFLRNWGRGRFFLNVDSYDGVHIDVLGTAQVDSLRISFAMVPQLVYSGGDW